MKTQHTQFRIFIADSHLREEDAGMEEFFAMLQAITEFAPGEVVFLGDIFELWIGLKYYETPSHIRFLEWCRRNKQNFRIGFVEGNHEFYLSRYHADAFTWCTDRIHTEPEYIALHGDTVNRKDWKYLLLRRSVRSHFICLLLRLFGKSIGPRISDHVRRSLKNTNLANKKQLPCAYLEAMHRQMKVHPLPEIFCGHFHQEKQIVCGETMLEILPAWNIGDGGRIVMTGSGTIRRGPWRELLE